MLYQHGTSSNAYLMTYSDARYNLEQGLSKAHPVMSIVQLHEAEQRRLELPLATFFFYPRSGHSEVPISVGGLPCVASQADQTVYRLSLRKNDTLGTKDRTGEFDRVHSTCRAGRTAVA